MVTEHLKPMPTRLATALIAVLLVATAPLVAQDATEPPSDVAVSDSTGIEAGYEKNGWNGFFIRSKDGEFRLNIGAYTQVRYSANWRTRPDTAQAGENDFTQGWSVPRTRIIFDGDFTKRVYYHFRANIDATSDFELIAAFAQYSFSPEWNVRVGKQWIALSREDWIFPQDVATVEFSANDFTYAIWSSTGIQAQRQSERTRLWLGLSNGAFGGRQGFPSAPDAADGMVSSRFEFQVSGRDWSVWNDLIGRRGRSKGVLLGLAGAYQVRDEDTAPFRNGAQLNGDVSINGNGYHVLFAGSWTTRQEQSREWNNVYGFLAQGTYFVSDHTYLYGRFDGVFKGDAPEATENFTALAAGAGWIPFLWTNRWRVNAEVSYLPQTLNNTLVAPSGMLGFLSSDTPTQWNVRLQSQFGF